MMPSTPRSVPQHAVSAPVASSATVGKLEKIWASLPAADREVLLGHSDPMLSAADRLKLTKLLAALGKQRRSQR